MSNFNSWGFGQFVLTIPIGLVIIYLISSFPEIWDTLKLFMDKESNVFMFIITIVIGVMIAVLLYVWAILKLKQAYEVGLRKRQTCGNEYLEADTENYMLYASFHERSSIRLVKASYIILHLLMMSTLAWLVSYNWRHLTDKDRSFAEKLTSWSQVIYPVVAIILLTTSLSTDFNKNIDKPSYSSSYSYVMPANLISALVILFTGVVLQQVYGSPATIDAKQIIVSLDSDNIQLIILTFFVGIALIVFKKFEGLAGSIKVSYDKLKSDLDSAVVKLSGGLKTYASIYNKARGGGTDYATQFCKYLVKNIKSDPKYQSTDPSDDTPLWPYIMHQENGKELDIIYSLNGVLGEDGITCVANSSKTTTSNCDTIVDPLRTCLRALRGFKDPSKALNTLVSMCGLIFFGVLLLIVYPMFHSKYQQDKISMGFMVCLTIVVMFILASFYGWVSKIIP